ncbi:hypothetical protein Tco_0594759 [Tanacetum coccineum]
MEDVGRERARVEEVVGVGTDRPGGREKQERRQREADTSEKKTETSVQRSERLSTRKKRAGLKDGVSEARRKGLDREKTGKGVESRGDNKRVQDSSRTGRNEKTRTGVSQERKSDARTRKTASAEWYRRKDRKSPIVKKGPRPSLGAQLWRKAAEERSWGKEGLVT